MATYGTRSGAEGQARRRETNTKQAAQANTEGREQDSAVSNGGTSGSRGCRLFFFFCFFFSSLAFACEIDNYSSISVRIDSVFLSRPFLRVLVVRSPKTGCLVQ